MTPAGAAGAGAVVVALVAVAAAMAVVIPRARRARQAQADATVRPLLFRAMDEGAFAPGTVDALTPAQQRALEARARSLLPSLKGRDRELLAQLLDRRGAVTTARRQSRSKRAATRARAGAFLGEAGSPAAVTDLLALLHDPDPQVRWAAARGLGRLGNRAALSPLLASLEGARPMPVDVVADAIFQIRECPVSLLRQGVKSRSLPTRAVAIELLGRNQHLSAVSEVIELLHDDPSVEVRARAARCLGRMGTPGAVEPLLACLGSGPTPVRVQAIWALGEIGGPQVVLALGLILLEPSPQMGELAATALLALGPPGEQALSRIAAGTGLPAAIAADALAQGRHLTSTAS